MEYMIYRLDNLLISNYVSDVFEVGKNHIPKHLTSIRKPGAMVENFAFRMWATGLNE